MICVYLRFPSQKKLRWNKPISQEWSSKKAKKDKHFLNIFDGYLYGETKKILMVDNILISIHLDLLTNQKNYITPLKTWRTWLDTCICKYKWSVYQFYLCLFSFSVNASAIHCRWHAVSQTRPLSLGRNSTCSLRLERQAVWFSGCQPLRINLDLRDLQAFQQQVYQRVGILSYLPHFQTVSLTNGMSLLSQGWGA